MAIPAISPIGTPPFFVEPLAPARTAALAQPFNATLTNSLNVMAQAAAATPATTTSPQLVNSLEQTLFSQWLASLQSSTSTGALPTSLDNVLGQALGLTGITGGLPSTLDASNPQAMLFTARLVSLFNTVDLLGGDNGLVGQPGSMLDTLA